MFYRSVIYINIEKWFINNCLGAITFYRTPPFVGIQLQATSVAASKANDFPYGDARIVNGDPCRLMTSVAWSTTRAPRDTVLTSMHYCESTWMLDRIYIIEILFDHYHTFVHAEK